MRQTHSIAAKNPGNVSYVSCKLYVLVSLEGANFKESIIIYHPYLAIPKSLKLWQKPSKNSSSAICILPKFIMKTHNFPFRWETKSASASPRMDSWVFSRATLVKSPPNGTNRGTRGSRYFKARKLRHFLLHNAWGTMERKQRDQSSRVDEELSFSISFTWLLRLRPFLTGTRLRGIICLWNVFYPCFFLGGRRHITYRLVRQFTHRLTTPWSWPCHFTLPCSVNPTGPAPPVQRSSG